MPRAVVSAGMSTTELTTADVAGRLGRPERTVRLWCKQGRFKGARSESTPRGDYWLIPESALKDFQEPKRGAPKKAQTNVATKKAAKKSGKK